MSNTKENHKKPETINGEDYLIMVRIAEYVQNHEPFNEYFDPVRAEAAFERDKQSWDPEDRFHFQRIFPEAVAKQSEAFSEAFKIIELFLTENPDIDISVLDKVYSEMAKLYGFNYHLNQTYLRFRSYYHDSREYMRSLESRFPDKAHLVNYLTGIKNLRPGNFEIKRGPFAFEIRVKQEDLNKFDRSKTNISPYEEILEKILPSTNLGGVNFELPDQNSDTKANFIIYRLDEPVLDFFRRFEDYLRERRINRKIADLNFSPQTYSPSNEVFRTHENQHALYNLILTAEKKASSRDIVAEIETILKESDKNKVTDADFSNFCFYLVKNAVYENAAHEILARIKDGNFIASVKVITNPNVYNYNSTYMVGVDNFSNLFAEKTLREFLEHSDPIKAQNFTTIYNSYLEQANNYIYNLAIQIAQFLQKHPTKNRELTNILMFKTLDKWSDEINRYSVYLNNL
jgi:hypothetical protein